MLACFASQFRRDAVGRRWVHTFKFPSKNSAMTTDRVLAGCIPREEKNKNKKTLSFKGLPLSFDTFCRRTKPADFHEFSKTSLLSARDLGIALDEVKASDLWLCSQPPF
jgi:hypothetical protein